MAGPRRGRERRRGPRLGLARPGPLAARGAHGHEELSDGAVVVELPYGSTDWLVREILKGVGDLVVLEPDDARDAVLQAVSGK